MTCKCPNCGATINPAALLGSAKKTMTEAAVQQRTEAARKPRKRKKPE